MKNGIVVIFGDIGKFDIVIKDGKIVYFVVNILEDFVEKVVDVEWVDEEVGVRDLMVEIYVEGDMLCLGV